MLLGGLLALWPARSASRQAVVRRRRIAAVAPAWVLVLLGIAAVGGPAPRRGGQWAAFGVTAACALVAVVVIVLALGDPAVDRGAWARMRSVRSMVARYHQNTQSRETRS
ncbi:hypothetical protein BAY59_26720 [Prauserella coralliicola]|nr:hypothetical protein BAY59_26720 [Prauserella coralliicola]